MASNQPTGAGGATSSATATGGPVPGSIEAMTEVLERNWWVMALRGVLGIVFGLIAFFWPQVAMLSLAWVFGAYLLVDGIFGVIASVRAARQGERWALLVLEGILSIVAGVIALIWPLIALITFEAFVAAWAIVSGALMVWAAFRVDKAAGRWWLGLGGLASIVFGVLIVIAPLAGLLVLTWWVGAYAIVFGIMLLVFAFRLHKRHQEKGSAGAPRPA